MNIRPEHAKAVQIASEALDVEMKPFDVRFHVSTRMHAHVTIKAIDVDHCRQLVEQFDLYNEMPVSRWELQEAPDVEGDEIAFIEIEDDEGLPTDEVEIDLRNEGEPFSWVAVELVKALAQIDKRQKKLTPRIKDLLRQCREACATPKPSEGENEDEPSGAA